MDRLKTASHISSHTLLNVLANFSRIITSSLVLIYVARKLGPFQYGIVSIGLSVAAIAQLFCDFGVSTSTARFLADRETPQSRVYHNGLLLNISLSLIFSIILFMSAETIAPLLNLDSAVHLKIVCIFTFFTSLFYFSTSSLQGIKKSNLIALLNFLQNIISGILIFAAAYLGLEAAGVLLGYSISTAIIWIAAFIVLRKTFRMTKRMINGDIIRNILSYALPLLVTSSSYLLLLRGPPILLSMFVNPDAVSYLHIPMRLAEVVSLPAYSLSIVIAPFFTIKERTKGNLQWLYVKIFKYSLVFYLPSGLFFFLAASRIINSIFGSEYSNAATVLIIFSFYIPFFSISIFTGKILDFLGLAKQKSVMFIIAAAITIISSVIVIPTFKETGAAMAITIPYSLFSIYTIIKSSRECGVKLSNYLSKAAAMIPALLLAGITASFVLQSLPGLRGLIIAFAAFTVVFTISATILRLIRFGEVRKLISTWK